MARDLHYSPALDAAAIVVPSLYPTEPVMEASQVLQRWAGRVCLLLVAALGMMGYYFANVRFLPVMAGFAILAAVCYVPRVVSQGARPLRESGQRPAI